MRIKDYDYGTYTNVTCFCNGIIYEGDDFESPSKTGKIKLAGYCLMEETIFSGAGIYKDSLEIIQGGDDIDVSIDGSFEMYTIGNDIYLDIPRYSSSLRQVNSFKKEGNKISFYFLILTDVHQHSV